MSVVLLINTLTPIRVGPSFQVAPRLSNPVRTTKLNLSGAKSVTELPYQSRDIVGIYRPSLHIWTQIAVFGCGASKTARKQNAWRPPPLVACSVKRKPRIKPTLVNLLHNHLPKIPSSEKVVGWCSAGSANSPPTPGPSTPPTVQDAGQNQTYIDGNSNKYPVGSRATIRRAVLSHGYRLDKRIGG